MKKRLLTFVSLIMLIGMSGLLQAEWIDRTDPVGSGIISVSSQIGDGESGPKAFDNSQYTKWLTSFTTTGWIQYQFADNKGYAISKYTIRSANDAPDRSPKDWQLLGSYDGENWVVVDTQTGIEWTTTFTLKEFTCDNNIAFPIYRLDMSLNNGSGNLLGFSEMELYEDVVPKAGDPTPANLAKNVAVDASLSWVPASGPTVTQHKVYMTNGSIDDPNLYLVATIDASSPASFTPAAELSRDFMYSWRVDEVTTGGVITGDVWAFNTVLSIPMADMDYPADASIWPGESTILTASAINPFTGNAEGLSYAWSKDGELLTSSDLAFSGIDTASLTVEATDPNDGGDFTCSITLDINGRSVDSRTAFVDVKALVGHWTFDTDASDSTSYNSDGAFVGDTVIAEGKIGQAIDLDGNGDYVTIPVNYPQNARVTVTAWVYARTTPTWASIAKNWPGQFHFGLNSGNGTLDFEAGPAAAPSVRVTEQQLFPTGQWQFTAGVADGEKIRLYRNGVEVGQARDYDGTLNVTNQVLAIGCKLDGEVPSSYWDGLIDDVRIYNAALNAEDIAGLYIDVQGGSVCVNPPVYDFDGDCVVSLTDFAIFAAGWLDCNLVPNSACE
ncbi:MAG: hypothetical protein JEZ07_05905 [Phycisphaerae bacterium]|nr:hypothetical protein [Phycisphaerae bacterium]